MAPDRLRTDEKQVGDFLCGIAFGNQVQDLAFAIGELLVWVHLALLSGLPDISVDYLPGYSGLR